MRRFGARGTAVVIVTVAVLLAACTSGPRKVERGGEPDVYAIAKTDAAMDGAISKAQKTLETFARNLAHPGANQGRFTLKVRLDDGQHVEHIWLAEPVVTTATVVGIIDNEPVELTGYKLGQKVSLPHDRVSDWMFVQDGVLQGGYTLRVLRDRMTQEEREEFDRKSGFRIE